MTKIQIEARLYVVESIILFLEKRLIKYREEEGTLVMELNRARRLEREAKELQA